MQAMSVNSRLRRGDAAGHRGQAIGQTFFLDDIHRVEDQVLLRLGDPPVPVPAPFADLLLTLVPADENLAAIEEALLAGGNARVTVRKRPGLNHLFQASETGGLSEYGRNEESIAPVALELIPSWIGEQVGAR